MGQLSHSPNHEMSGIPPLSGALLTTTHHAEDLTCIPMTAKQQGISEAEMAAIRRINGKGHPPT
jgi:hypothetical protein